MILNYTESVQHRVYSDAEVLASIRTVSVPKVYRHLSWLETWPKIHKHCRTI